MCTHGERVYINTDHLLTTREIKGIASERESRTAGGTETRAAGEGDNEDDC